MLAFGAVDADLSRSRRGIAEKRLFTDGNYLVFGLDVTRHWTLNVCDIA